MLTKTATLLSALLLSASWAGDAQAYGAYATTSLNVRSGPSTGYPVITTLSRGEQVEVISCAGSWCRIDLGGGQGFASASYLASAGPRAVYRPPVVVAPAPFYVERYNYGSNYYRYRDRHDRRHEYRHRRDRDRSHDRSDRLYPKPGTAIRPAPGARVREFGPRPGQPDYYRNDGFDLHRRHERDGSNS